MGSFNVACSVSNISICSGDPVAFIPLEMAKYPYKIGDGNHMLIYSTCFYAPATMPMFGKYDDYGGVEDIIRDKNLGIIEKFFGKTIKRIRNASEIGKPISSGMFVHKEIFDCMIRDMQMDEWGEYSYGKYSYSTRPMVISKYFKYKEEIKKAQKRRADHIKLQEEMKKVRTPFSRFGTMDKTIFSGTYLGGLVKRKYSGLRGNQRERITQPPFLHQNATPDLKTLRSFEASKDHFLKLENNMFNVNSAFKFRDWEYKTFNAIYQPAIVDHDPTKDDGGFLTALIDFVMFEGSLYSTNNFYFPAMNGYQCGHKYASKILYTKAKEIMEREIAEREAADKEWDEYFERKKEEKREILFRKFN
jgi:hypothetical protein